MIRGRGGRGEVGKNRDESWRNLRIYGSQQTDIFLFRSEQRLIDRFLETEGRSAPPPLPHVFFQLFSVCSVLSTGRGGRWEVKHARVKLAG